jgi:hypothetical protein
MTTREKLYARTIAPLVPSTLGTLDGFPEIEVRRVAEESARYVCGGPPEVFIVSYGGVLLLKLLALLTCRKPFKSLTLDEQKAMLQKSSESRFMALRMLPILVGLPIKTMFYNQDDVCRVLGYDRESLIEDARQHQVSIDR